MEEMRNKIGDWIPLIWWALMALLVACAFACCVSQAVAKVGVFWASCGAVGSGLAFLILAWQVYGEWVEIRNQ